MTVDRKLAHKVTDGVIKSFFAHGTLTEADLELPDKDFYDKFFKIVKKTKIGMIVDHRSDILTQAEIFLQNKNFEYSKVFYAMFFEHSLNGIIENECQKRMKKQRMTSLEVLTFMESLHGCQVY